jgi:hypothetical protein
VQARGRLAEAESLLEEATAVMTARLGPEAMNTNVVRANLGRVHAEQGQHAKAAAELRIARERLGAVMGPANPRVGWIQYELAGALGARGPSLEADSLFAALADAPRPPLLPGDMPRFHLTYGRYLARIGHYVEADRYLVLAESGLREPRESDVRRRVQVLEALVELERARGTRAPSPARAVALRKWTSMREAEMPELRAAIAAGRAPRGIGPK